LGGQKEKHARAHQHGVEKPEPPIINWEFNGAFIAGNYIHVGIK